MTQSNQPVQEFSDCHAGIFKQLQLLGGLPELLTPAVQAQRTAENAIDFFRGAVFEHHLDEERELFPAVLAAAENDEVANVQSIVARLVADHRELESMWKQLESGLKRVSKGNFSDVDTSLIGRLVQQYQVHARYEESDFLPLAKTILGRSSEKTAELGRSLHLRHKGMPVQSFF